MTRYIATAHRRLRERRAAVEARRRHAWALAARAAEILRAEFDAHRVVVIGSLAEERLFDERSDIGLVAWGVPAHERFRAAGRLLDLDPAFEIDLVRDEDAPAGLLELARRGSAL
jgi:hypothetical protein